MTSLRPIQLPRRLAVSVVATVVAACSGGSSTTAVSEKLGTELLDLVAAVDAQSTFFYSDIDSATDTAGLDPIEPGESIIPLLDELLERGAKVSFGGLSGDLEEPGWEQVVGVNPGDISEVASFFYVAFDASLITPRDQLSLDELEDRLRLDPVWGPDLVRVETENGTYLDWDTVDDQGSDIARAGVLRGLGQPGQVGLAGDTIVWSIHSGLVEDALDLRENADRSLAADDLVVELFADYDGPAPQAFMLWVDPPNDFSFIVLNLATDDGRYEAQLRVIDPTIEGEPALPLVGTEPVPTSRSGRVLIAEATSDDAFDQLLDCILDPGCREPS